MQGCISKWQIQKHKSLPLQGNQICPGTADGDARVCFSSGSCLCSRPCSHPIGSASWYSCIHCHPVGFVGRLLVHNFFFVGNESHGNQGVSRKCHDSWGVCPYQRYAMYCTVWADTGKSLDECTGATVLPKDFPLYRDAESRQNGAWSKTVWWFFQEHRIVGHSECWADFFAEAKHTDWEHAIRHFTRGYKVGLCVATGSDAVAETIRLVQDRPRNYWRMTLDQLDQIPFGMFIFDITMNMNVGLHGPRRPL